MDEYNIEVWDLNNANLIESTPAPTTIDVSTTDPITVDISTSEKLNEDILKTVSAIEAGNISLENLTFCSSNETDNFTIFGNGDN